MGSLALKLFDEGIPLGRYWRIPVILDATTILLFGVLLFQGPSHALKVACVYFFVLLHEFGHSLAARYYGIETTNIRIYPYGGVASITSLPQNPWGLFVVSAAGPAVNLVIVLCLSPVLLSGVAPEGSWIRWVFDVNAVLLIFNTLPAFPMDGGRMFAAFLWKFMAKIKAWTIAFWVGRAFFVGLAIFGVMNGAWMMPIVALVMWSAASAEVRAVRASEA